MKKTQNKLSTNYILIALLKRKASSVAERDADDGRGSWSRAVAGDGEYRRTFQIIGNVA